jgi:transposase
MTCICISTFIFKGNSMSISKSSIAINAINAVYRVTGSREITGKMLGISGSTVIRVLKSAGKSVQAPGRPSEQLSAPKLVTAYWARNESLRQISARVGVSPSTVARRMAALGIPTRSN